MITISKGLDLPISGRPEQVIDAARTVRHVALVGPDYHGMKPTMRVNEGDRVETGQVLFSDKKTEGVEFVSPASGTVTEVNRGAKRAFQSVVVELDETQGEGRDFGAHGDLSTLNGEIVREKLLASGLWSALRTRPYSKTPAIDTWPRSIFVQAIDTNPLAPDPTVVIAERQAEFAAGLQVLTNLTEGPVFLCKAGNASGRGETLPGEDVPGVRTEAFSGPHPAGLPGTHIHMLDPVGPGRTVWTIGYQDVIAYGHLMLTGRLLTERVVSLAGPKVRNPRLVRTRLGASLAELVEGELEEGTNRVVSGSVLSGRTAAGPLGYLGRFVNQITVLEEGTHREFLGWQRPGPDKFSIKRLFVGSVTGAGPSGRRFDMTTDRMGSTRAMVPVGSYEAVLPLDMEPTFLLRSLITRDTDTAQALGALELDEEDLGLCTYVCPGKYEYGGILRDNLETIEREG